MSIAHTPQISGVPSVHTTTSVATVDAEKSLFFSNPIVSAISDLCSSFAERRAKLGLSNPGTVELVNREVSREVFLNNHMFAGLRGDLTKTMSSNPLFQVSHQFSMIENTGPYSIAGLYGTDKTFLQAHVENTGQIMARFNYRLSERFISKTQVQLTPRGGDMAKFEHEYTGEDFTASVEVINPSTLGGGLTGIFVGHYLQSITPKLAIGLQGIWQRQAMNQGPESSVSYVARYKSAQWIASAQLLAQGALITSYWRRLGEKCQAGTEMQISLAPQPGVLGPMIKKEGLTTFGLKWDFRMATMRAQLDSRGKLACMLDKRLMMIPNAQVSFGADVDYWTQKAKVGVGISFDMSTDELQEAAASTGQPPQTPNIPF